MFVVVLKTITYKKHEMYKKCYCKEIRNFSLVTKLVTTNKT